MCVSAMCTALCQETRSGDKDTCNARKTSTKVIITQILHIHVYQTCTSCFENAHLSNSKQLYWDSTRLFSIHLPSLLGNQTAGDDWDSRAGENNDHPHALEMKTSFPAPLKATTCKMCSLTSAVMTDISPSVAALRSSRLSSQLSVNLRHPALSTFMLRSETGSQIHWRTAAH